MRSYLHVNCSTCHVNEGGGNSNMELDLTTPNKRMRLIDEAPIHGNLDIKDARLVAPGSPERSVLYRRISRRGSEQMPPLGSNEVEPLGRQADRRLDSRLAGGGAMSLADSPRKNRVTASRVPMARTRSHLGQQWSEVHSFPRSVPKVLSPFEDPHSLKVSTFERD